MYLMSGGEEYLAVDVPDDLLEADPVRLGAVVPMAAVHVQALVRDKRQLQHLGDDDAGAVLVHRRDVHQMQIDLDLVHVDLPGSIASSLSTSRLSYMRHATSWS